MNKITKAASVAALMAASASASAFWGGGPWGYGGGPYGWGGPYGGYGGHPYAAPMVVPQAPAAESK